MQGSGFQGFEHIIFLWILQMLTGVLVSTLDVQLSKLSSPGLSYELSFFQVDRSLQKYHDPATSSCNMFASGWSVNQKSPSNEDASDFTVI